MLEQRNGAAPIAFLSTAPVTSDPVCASYSDAWKQTSLKPKLSS